MQSLEYNHNIAQIEKEYTFRVPALVSLLPEGLSSALDVGCSSGALAKYLRNQQNYKCIVGIEHSKNAAEKAKQYCEQVYVGDVSNISLEDKYIKGFDVIFYADILEHLYSPESIIINHSKYLKSDGYILISVPNIRNFFIILNLLHGRFDYTKTGLLDDGHIRFFTIDTICEMFKKVGFTPLKIQRSIRDSAWHVANQEGKVSNQNIVNAYQSLYDAYMSGDDCLKSVRKYIGLAYLSPDSIADFLTVQYYILFQKNTKLD